MQWGKVGGGGRLQMCLSLIVCWIRNRSALVCELLSNNSPFVGQLYEDKSLMI